MHKIVYSNNSQSPFLPELKLESLDHNYQTRNGGNLRTPFPRTDSLKYNYQYQFINTWNNIPTDIRAIESFRIFKKSLYIYIPLYCSEASESDSDLDLKDSDEFSSVDTDTDSVMDSEDFEGF